MPSQAPTNVVVVVVLREADASRADLDEHLHLKVGNPGIDMLERVDAHCDLVGIDVGR